MASALSDEVEAQLAERRPLESIVRGDPELLATLYSTRPELRAAADAVPLQALLPELTSIPSAGAPAADGADAGAPFGRGADGSWGSAYAALAEVVERRQQQLLADQGEGTREGLVRAEVTASGLVAVGRLYARVELVKQLKKLTLPGHEALIGFAVTHLLPAAARARSGVLGDAACKLVACCSFDRLTEYDISEAYFDVRKARALDAGWVPPADDADLYGIGWALLAAPKPFSGLRALMILATGERWLTAQAAVALLGTAACAAPDGSHKGPASANPLRDGLARCLAEPEAGELAGVLGAVVALSLLGGSEDGGGFLRTGLGAAAIRGWRDGSRPLTSALCAYLLADLCETANGAGYRPWKRMKSEAEIERAQPPPAFQDDPDRVAGWRAKMRTQRRSALLMQESYEAGVAIFRQQLADAGLELPPARRRRRGEAAAPAAAVDRSAGDTRFPPSEDEAIAAAWAALPPERAARMPAGQGDANGSFWALRTQLEGLFQAIAAAWAALPPERAARMPVGQGDANDSFWALRTELEGLFQAEIEADYPRGVYHIF